MKFIVGRETCCGDEKPLGNAYEIISIDESLCPGFQETRKWFIDIDNLEDLVNISETIEHYETLIINRNRFGFPEIYISSSPC